MEIKLIYDLPYSYLQSSYFITVIISLNLILISSIVLFLFIFSPFNKKIFSVFLYSGKISYNSCSTNANFWVFLQIKE